MTKTCLLNAGFWVSILLTGCSCYGNDKAMHFGVSALFGAGAETGLHHKTELKALPRIALSTALGSVPGLVKEVVDSTQDGNHFSGRDMTANVAGALVGASLSSVINHTIVVRAQQQENQRLTVSLALSF